MLHADNNKLVQRHSGGRGELVAARTRHAPGNAGQARQGLVAVTLQGLLRHLIAQQQHRRLRPVQVHQNQSDRHEQQIHVALQSSADIYAQLLSAAAGRPQ